MILRENEDQSITEFGGACVFLNDIAKVSVRALEHVQCYRLLDRGFELYVQPMLKKFQDISNIFQSFARQYVEIFICDFCNLMHLLF